MTRCRAKSKQSGQRCKRAAHPGATVCVMHGAGSKKVQQAARERLAALVDPSIDRLRQLIRSGRPDAVRLQAAKDALDRNGLRAPTKIDMTVSINALRDRLDRMPEADVVRLTELLARNFEDLDEHERAELLALRETAGFGDTERPE